MVKINLYDVYVHTKEYLNSACISNHSMEAKWFINYFLKFNVSEIYLKKNVTVPKSDLNRLKKAIKLRSKRFPFQYILGEALFYGRNFFVGEGVLIPRSDTEVLCELAIENIAKNRYNSVLDLCSGTGCIAITLEKETAISDITCVEYFEEACKYLLKNRDLYNSNLKFFKSDVFNPDESLLKRKYDIIVSNPPYLDFEDIKNLQGEVLYEPISALCADDSGMGFYKHIIENWTKSLAFGGIIMFEVGIFQAKTVCEMLGLKGFSDITVKKDYNGVDRVVFATKLF